MVYIICNCKIILFRKTNINDGFDSLIDAPLEKIEYVQTNLMKFVNSHLSKLDITIENLTGDFNDGVNLILLIGLLKGM